MIKFFRNIRKDLRETGKTGRYFKYAIGEIILVMIGILLALQVNNWNEHRKDLAKEKQILVQLKSEYENNLIQLEEKITMREQAILASYQILNAIDNPKDVSEEQLLSNMWVLLRDPTFDPIKNDIIETDNLRLIRNDSLIRVLSNWTSDVYQVQELELEFQKFRNNGLFPNYNKLGVSRNMHNHLWKDGYSPTEALNKNQPIKLNINKSKKPLDLEVILSNTELEGMVSSVITFHQMTNLQSQALKERINKILSMINRELEK
jgi:hypothetical protein